MNGEGPRARRRSWVTSAQTVPGGRWDAQPPGIAASNPPTTTTERDRPMTAADRYDTLPQWVRDVAQAHDARRVYDAEIRATTTRAARERLNLWRQLQAQGER